MPASSVLFGRALLLLGAACALGAAWLGIFAAAFGMSYNSGLGATALIALPFLTLAAAMIWVCYRFWRRGFGQRGPRLVAGLIAALALCLAVWSMLYDPGDAVFVVPVLAFVGVVFALMAATAPR